MTDLQPHPKTSRAERQLRRDPSEWIPLVGVVIGGLGLLIATVGAVIVEATKGCP